MNPNRRSLWYALLCTFAGLLVLLVLLRVAQTAELASEIRQAQVTNGRTLDTSAQTLKVIKDCTQPAGKCYLRGRHQTQEAVSNINRVVILAAFCASQHPRQTVAQIQSCVIYRLAAQSHKR